MNPHTISSSFSRRITSAADAPATRGELIDAIRFNLLVVLVSLFVAHLDADALARQAFARRSAAEDELERPARPGEELTCPGTVHWERGTEVQP